jgi:hypothetical protein
MGQVPFWEFHRMFWYLDMLYWYCKIQICCAFYTSFHIIVLQVCLISATRRPVSCDMTQHFAFIHPQCSLFTQVHNNNVSYHRDVLKPSVYAGAYIKFQCTKSEEPVQLRQYSVWLWAGRLGDQGTIPGRGERIFPLTSVSRPALGPTQPPVQWVPGVVSPGLKRGRGVMLTTHPI